MLLSLLLTLKKTAKPAFSAAATIALMPIPQWLRLIHSGTGVSQVLEVPII
jgi:hypothetical protein